MNAQGPEYVALHTPPDLDSEPSTLNDNEDEDVFDVQVIPRSPLLTRVTDGSSASLHAGSLTEVRLRSPLSPSALSSKTQFDLPHHHNT